MSDEILSLDQLRQKLLKGFQCRPVALSQEQLLDRLNATVLDHHQIAEQYNEQFHLITQKLGQHDLPAQDRNDYSELLDSLFDKAFLFHQKALLEMPHAFIDETPDESSSKEVD